MPSILELSALATGLEKFSFYFNPKEGQCQRMFKIQFNCTHFTCWQGNAQNPSSYASTVCEPKTSRCSRLPAEISTTLDYTSLMAESEKEIKSFLMSVKEENEKAGLKLNIQKMKIMASSPITSWQIDEEKMETVTDFISSGSKITVDCESNHEIKRYLLLRRKAMTNLDSILKSRDITFLTKVCMVKAMVFPVVEYRCESWRAECQRINAFDLQRWRRLLRVPWTVRRSNQSILKEINSEY